MSRDLSLQLLLSAKEKVSGPLANIMRGSKGTSAALRKQHQALKALQKAQSNIASYERLSQANEALAGDISSADRRVADLARQLETTRTPTKKLTRDFAAAQRAAQRLRDKHQNNHQALDTLRDKLQAAGVNTSDLGNEQRRLAQQIDGASDAIQRHKKRLAGLHRLQQRGQKITAAGGRVMSEAGKLAGRGLLAMGAAGYVFKNQFLDTAAQFEEFEAVLKVVEGSSDKARASLNWVSDFAAQTPYQLADVTEAFVQLRNYGLDPTNGLLRTLGDTSAAMNKDIMQSVEAIADAITGENERLKEFGIRASKGGGRITYEYTDRNGQQQRKSAREDDRKAIEATLRTIWNDKYGGAMAERARTWRGMLSNMSDQWTRFTHLVMGAGLFDWMKDKLGGLLERINQMAADGSLQKTAADWGARLAGFASGVWAAGDAIFTTTARLAEMVGGGENLVLLLAGVTFAPLIASAVALGVALGPVGLAITGIVAGITAIVSNWDKVSDWFGEVLGGDGGNSAASRMAGRQRAATASQNSGAITAVNRPPVYQFDASAAGSGISIGQISVTAAPGMDTRDVADQVVAKLEQQQRRRRNRRRSTMADSD